jgi:hypothetical protein
MTTRTFLHGATAALVAAAGAFAQVDRVPAGTEIVVRTNEAIDAKHPSDSRIYTGSIERDVRDRNDRVVIPKGTEAELIMRDATDTDVVIDLESITMNGRRYIVDSQSETVTGDETRREGLGTNKRTGKYVGGGAVVGSIIGAIIGGGKGAAIGAATGAGAGAVGQTATRGGRVRLPSESVLTFRLDRALRVGPADDGFTRDGRHYHRSEERRLNN